ncbi:T9SS type A sorting domain-containing protein [Flavobacterium sp. ST-75]|uniref:T9SS type A sorting domain-containing protein n=1 Tax=Flavobacterium rhizophilum TaxID=3163296 RepID=A0ABW8YCC2_9FLAO
MKRITLPANFRPYHGNAVVNRYSRFLLFFVMLLMGYTAKSQIYYTTGWESSIDGWQSSGNAGSFSTSSTNPCSGDQSVRANIYYGLNSILTSPAISFSDGSEVTFTYSFKVMQYASSTSPAVGDDFTLDVQWTNDLSGTWTTLETIDDSNYTSTTDCAERTVTFIPANGDTVYVRFYASSMTGEDLHIYFDDVTIAQTTCIPPTALTLNNANTGEVSWTAPETAPASGYEYYLATTSEVPGPATVATGTTTETVATLTTLPDTQYYFWVRGNCGGEFSPWAGPLMYVSPQVPAVLPFEEDFEDGTTLYLNNGDETNQWFVGDAVNNGGTSALYVSSDNGVSNTYSHTSSVVQAYRDVAVPEDLAQMEISFDWKSGGESNYDYLRVWVVPTNYTLEAGSQISSSSGGEQVAQLNLSEGEFISASFVVNVDEYQGGIARIVFEWRNDGGSGDEQAIAIDNLSVTEVSCNTPQNLAATVGLGNVMISWEFAADLPAGGFDYYYSTTNEAPDDTTEVSGNIADATTVTVNGLEFLTEYYFWVRSNCDGSESEWVSGGSFVTECDITTLPYVYDFSDYDGNTEDSCWQEKTGALGTAVTLTGGSSTWTNGNYNNSGSNSNGTAALINLYDEDNAWIISPAFDLGDGSITYQLEFDASILPWTGSTPVTDMEEKYGQVVISTDGGLTWDEANVLVTFDNDNIPAGGVHQFISLEGYTGVIKIGFYGYSEDDTPDLRFYIDNFKVDVQPACALPQYPVLNELNGSSAQVSWTAAPVAPANGYEYYVSQSNEIPASDVEVTGSVEAGVLTATVADLPLGVMNYIWVRSSCDTDTVSDWVGPVLAMTPCEQTDLTIEEPADICGQGTIELEASTTNGDIYWYAEAEGGELLATGNVFETPYITETTSYYVSSAQLSLGANVKVGNGSGTTSTNSNPFYSSWSNNHTQHLITADELIASGLSAGNINSIGLDVTSVGSYAMRDLTIKIGASTATTMESFVANNDFSVVYTNAIYMPVSGVNTFYFNTPFNWDGTSNIVVEFCHGNPSSGATMSRTVKSDTTDYVSTISHYFSSSTSGSEACAATDGGNVNTYSVRPQFIFNGNGLCFSEREEVEVVVNEAPAVTISVTQDAICNGGSTTLTAVSDNEGYTYAWMPGDLTGAELTVSPEVTTTYTVTATDADSGCINVITFTVQVNPLPEDVEFAEESFEVCGSTVLPLSVTNAAVSVEAQFGTNETTTGVSEELTAFSNRRQSLKYQTIYTAEELTAAGVLPGEITSIAYNITSVGDENFNDNYIVKLGATTQDVFADTNYLAEDSFTTVYGPVTYTHAIGWNTINFTTPYIWDGVSNIVVSVSYSGADQYDNAETYYTTVTGNATLYNYNNTTATTGTASSKKFDIKISQNIEQEVTWSSVENLYLDEEATQPYTEGENAGTVYFKSQTAGVVNYTATMTNIFGCSVTADVEVNVNVTEVPDVGEEFDFCSAATVADLLTEDNNIVWYANETEGEALTEDTALETATYYASQIVNGCESERVAVAVTINIIPAPEGDEMQDIEIENGYVATIEDIEVTGIEGGEITWYANEEDALSGENPLVEGTEVEGETTYYAVQTVNGCSSEPLAVTITITLDSKEFDLASFTYWPNPVKDVLSISYSSQITTVKVYNMVGQEVLSQKINALEGTVNMSALQEGTYLVNVATDTATKTIRVIKKQ